MTGTHYDSDNPTDIIIANRAVTWMAGVGATLIAAGVVALVALVFSTRETVIELKVAVQAMQTALATQPKGVSLQEFTALQTAHFQVAKDHELRLHDLEVAAGQRRARRE